MKSNRLPYMIPGTPVGIEIYSAAKESPHYHEGFLEITYCLRGSATLTSRSIETVLSEGDIASCDFSDIHYITADGENLLATFYFDLKDPVFGRENLDKVYFLCEPLAIHESEQEELQNLKRLLLTLLYFYCFPHPKLSTAEILTRFSTKIIDAMWDHFHFFNFIVEPEDYSEEMKKRYDSIIIYINNHFSEKLTLSKICELHHFSYKYLSRFFKKTSHIGFARVVGDIRSYMSMKLLLDTDKNISDIAYEVGFSAPIYYYREFKSYNNMTPNQFRKMIRELSSNSVENEYFDVDAIKSDLEHSIAFRFAELQVPELWLMPFVPLKGFPSE